MRASICDGGTRHPPTARAHSCATSEFSTPCLCATGQQQRCVGEFDTFPAEFSSRTCFYMTGCAPPTIPDRKPANSKIDPDRPYSPSCSILRSARLCALRVGTGLLRAYVVLSPTHPRASVSHVAGRGAARESACGGREVVVCASSHMARGSVAPTPCRACGSGRERRLRRGGCPSPRTRKVAAGGGLRSSPRCAAASARSRACCAPRRACRPPTRALNYLTYLTRPDLMHVCLALDPGATTGATRRHGAALGGNGSDGATGRTDRGDVRGAYISRKCKF